MHKAHVYLIHFRRVAYTREQKENFLSFISMKMIWKMVLIAIIIMLIKN